MPKATNVPSASSHGIKKSVNNEPSVAVTVARKPSQFRPWHADQCLQGDDLTDPLVNLYRKAKEDFNNLDLQWTGKFRPDYLSICDAFDVTPHPHLLHRKKEPDVTPVSASSTLAGRYLLSTKASQPSHRGFASPSMNSSFYQTHKPSQSVPESSIMDATSQESKKNQEPLSRATSFHSQTTTHSGYQSHCNETPALVEIDSYDVHSVDASNEKLVIRGWKLDRATCILLCILLPHVQDVYELHVWRGQLTAEMLHLLCTHVFSLRECRLGVICLDECFHQRTCSSAFVQHSVMDAQSTEDRKNSSMNEEIKDIDQSKNERDENITNAAEHKERIDRAQTNSHEKHDSHRGSNVHENDIQRKHTSDISAKDVLSSQTTSRATSIGYALRRVLACSKRTRTLSVRGNYLDQRDAKEIALGLMQNNTLRTLILSDNCIGNEGAKYLAQGIRENLTIRALSLGNNEIADIGIRMLLTSVFPVEIPNESAVVFSRRDLEQTLFHEFGVVQDPYEPEVEESVGKVPNSRSKNKDKNAAKKATNSKTKSMNALQQVQTDTYEDEKVNDDQAELPDDDIALISLPELLLRSEWQTKYEEYVKHCNDVEKSEDECQERSKPSGKERKPAPNKKTSTKPKQTSKQNMVAESLIHPGNQSLVALDIGGNSIANLTQILGLIQGFGKIPPVQFLNSSNELFSLTDQFIALTCPTSAGLGKKNTRPSSRRSTRSRPSSRGRPTSKSSSRTEDNAKLEITGDPQSTSEFPQAWQNDSPLSKPVATSIRWINFRDICAKELVRYEWGKPTTEQPAQIVQQQLEACSNKLYKDGVTMLVNAQ